jgi:hypothetical protein
MYLPFFNNFTALDVQAVQGVRVGGILENHLRILIMEHNLKARQSLPALTTVENRTCLGLNPLPFGVVTLAIVA